MTSAIIAALTLCAFSGAVQDDAKRSAAPNRATANQPPPDEKPVAKSDDKAAAKPDEKGKVDAPKLIPENVPECQQAQKRFRDGDVGEAKRLLDLAAAKHPELPPSQVMLAALLLTGNQAQAGRAVLERAAIERAEHPEVHRHFGELGLAENRLTDAGVQFEKAIRLASDERWSLRQRQAFLSNAYAGMAAVAERRADWNAAYNNLYLLYKLDAENPKVRWRLGRALFFRDKPQEALVQFQQAFAADKTLEPPELTMGGLWSQKKEFIQAEKWLGDAVKGHKSDIRAHTGLSSYLLDQGRIDDARKSIVAGLQIEPENLQLRLLEVVVARAAKELDYAERKLQDLVSKHPSEFGATNQMALVLADQDDPRKKSQALDIATNNQKLYPNGVEAVTTLGWVMYRNGLTDRAEQALQTAVRTGQGSSDCAYYLGTIWSDKNRNDEAKKLFEAALAAPGTFVHRKECEEALKKLKEKPPEKTPEKKP